MVVVNLSKEAKEKLDEFYEMLNELYEKYLEFYEIKCKCCKADCQEISRAIEAHTRFIVDVFSFTEKKLSEKCNIQSTAAFAILTDTINKHTTYNYISSLLSELAKTGDIDYIM